ncbi:MAG: hypothetical protein VYC57_05605 [Verrucomicrobiota bacterium]|nr:hypothetical protein [Verrucomicrobiota bacterium]
MIRSSDGRTHVTCTCLPRSVKHAVLARAKRSTGPAILQGVVGVAR